MFVVKVGREERRWTSKCLAHGCDQMFTVFSFIKRSRFLENGDPTFDAWFGWGGGGD